MTDTGKNMVRLHGRTSRDSRSESRADSAEPHAERLGELLPVGIFRTDRAGLVISVNPAWLKIVGASKDTAIGSDWLQYVCEEDRSLVGDQWRSALRRSESFELDFRFRTPAGTVTWVRCQARPDQARPDQARPDQAEAGDLCGYVGCLSVITDLKDNHNQLVGILANLSEVVLLVSESGRILRVNPSVEKVFGYKPHEVLGEHCAVLVARDDRDTLSQVLLQAMQQDEGSAAARTIRMKGRTRSDSVVDIEVTPGEKSFSATGTSGSSGLIVVIRDVSERIRTENYLREKQKMAALIQVTRGVSHEFANIFSTMMGNMELLSRLVDEESRDRFIEPSLAAGERGGTLVQRLLSFNRQQPLNVAPVRIRDIEGALIELIEAEMSKNVNFVLDGFDCDACVDIDIEGFMVCMHQLLMNAVEAQTLIPTGLRQVEISVMEITRDSEWLSPAEQSDPVRTAGSRIRISVHDSGTGMTGEVLERCIDPFYSTREGHAGLGLSSVVGFVRQCGGFVTIDSTVDPGMTDSARSGSGEVIRGVSGTTVHLCLPGHSPAENRSDLPD